MRTLVIATDGSPSAREAVAFGLGLAHELDAAVVFAHVACGHGGERLPLEEATASARSRGVSATTEVLVGDPADEIVAYADSIDADAIVVGTRGHGGIAGALLGSVSQRVLCDARRPVLVVPRTARREDGAPAD
jgi:nucleotide-binding universal stress UspA family protein